MLQAAAGGGSCQAKCFSAAILSYTHHNYYVPFLLTKHPQRLLLSFFSFIKGDVSQKSPSLVQNRGRGQPVLLHPTLHSSSPRLPTSPVLWLCDCAVSLMLLQHSPHTPHKDLLESYLALRVGEEREKWNNEEIRDRGCGLSETLGYWSKWGQINPRGGREQVKMGRKPS